MKNGNLLKSAMDVTVEPFTDNIHLTEHNLDGTRVRGAVVLGKDKALVWDTLIFPEGIKGVAELCAERDIIVVYSHADWDHVWGTCALPYTEVIAHERCAARFADPEDVLRDLRAYQAKYPGMLDDIELVAPTRSFTDNLRLELGGLSAELAYLPGHTLDGCVAFIPELGVLLAGDAVETPLPLIYDDSPLSRWTNDLETWAADPRLKTCIPSHGEVGKGALEHTIAYLKAVQQGKTPGIPYELDEFYTNAHAANVRRAPKLT